MRQFRLSSWGKPAVSLAYSVKYDGIIGKDLRLPELVIPASGDARWDRGEISSSVDERLDYIAGNYGQLTSAIMEGVAALKKKAMIQIDQIAANLR